MIPVTARQWKRGQFSTFFSINHPAAPKPKALPVLFEQILGDQEAGNHPTGAASEL